ncbi:MAG: carboxymuconolactone decarboxylase family protein [Candidatus Omnitrophota bacterium]
METKVKLPNQIQDKIIDVGTKVIREGALEPKTKALVAVATAVSTFCTHCHGQFRATAKNLGATEEEIEEVETIALRMRQRCENETGLFKMNG